MRQFGDGFFEKVSTFVATLEPKCGLRVPCNMHKERSVFHSIMGRISVLVLGNPIPGWRYLINCSCLLCHFAAAAFISTNKVSQHFAQICSAMQKHPSPVRWKWVPSGAKFISGRPSVKFPIISSNQRQFSWVVVVVYSL